MRLLASPVILRKPATFASPHTLFCALTQYRTLLALDLYITYTALPSTDMLILCAFLHCGSCPFPFGFVSICFALLVLCNALPDWRQAGYLHLYTLSDAVYFAPLQRFIPSFVFISSVTHSRANTGAYTFSNSHIMDIQHMRLDN